MKRFFLLLLIVVVVALAVSELLGPESGYILVQMAGYSIEMTAWTGLMLLLAMAVLLSFTLRMWMFLQRLFTRNSRGSAVLRRPPGDLTSRATARFVAGDWRRAERQLLRAAGKDEAPVFNYLLAARASHEAGDSSRAEQHLLKAEQQGSSAAVPVRLTRAELLLQAGKPAQALQVLDELPPRETRHPVALRLRIEALNDCQDWPALLAQLGAARKQRALPPERLDELEHRASLGLLDAADGPEALRESWRNLSPNGRNDAEVVSRYAARLAAAGAADEAIDLLGGFLKHEWHGALVRLYGLLRGSDAHRQLEQAERWRRDHGEDPALLLSLGRLCLANRLWGKARDYLEASVEREPKLESCAELARLYEHLGDHARSSQIVQRGLSNSAVNLPVLPMPD